jgi:hypothetical protein
MSNSDLTLQRSRSVVRLIFMACGIWLIGLGLYFIVLRPPLLPEDPRYIGASLDHIQLTLPGLGRWLNHVFNVMGGFMAALGLLAAVLAVTAVPARSKGTGGILLAAGLASVVTMSWTNFAIDSTFKWLLFVPAVLWIVGTALYAFERLPEEPPRRRRKPSIPLR